MGPAFANLLEIGGERTKESKDFFPYFQLQMFMVHTIVTYIIDKISS